MQQADDPPSLSVGTEVSAKYKGAFCEAKVRKVVRNIKVKVAYKQGLGSGIVSDDAVKSGVLRVGAVVEVKHPDKREFVEATITKIQDCSQYTVVFDDGDITTLRRTALCLKSGRHFNESETLDQLPLTHPEHFSNPVIGGRRGRRSRHLHDDSSEEDDENDSKEVINEKEEHVGKIVWVESTETKKKDKEKWFPGLVVSPTAQATVRIRVKDEYLVRSFKDGRYYTVPKKDANDFTRELAAKQDGLAVKAALEYLDNDILPPHWDRDALFGIANSSSEYEGEVDSDSSDDEPREEKDHFVAQLYKHMDDRGTPLNKVPSITNRDVDLYRLFRAVQKLGGYNRVTSQNQWKAITIRLGFTPATVSVTNLVKQAYKKFLQPFEEFDRKLGCSMSMTPRSASRTKGRSLVRANSVASPRPDIKDKQEQKEKEKEKDIKDNWKTIAATVDKEKTNNMPASIITVVASNKANEDESENTSESNSATETTKTKRKLSTQNVKVKNLIEKFEDKNKDESELQPTTAATTVATATPTIVTTKSGKQSGKDDSATPTVTAAGQTTPGGRKEKLNRKSSGVEERRGRKKKEVTEVPEKPTEKQTESTTVADFPVEVGDKLKVYYHEKKVTYEAKVIDLSIQQGTILYLVHYTGWNTRYDEWVPKERIAENLSNNKARRVKAMSSNNQKSNTTPGNEKTTFTEVTSALTTTTPKTTERSTPTSKTGSASRRGRGRSDSQPPRSTTPSSITSRTKSPATSTIQRRTTRGQPSASRRTSNNISDLSMQTDSDSDSDEPVKKPSKSTTSSNASNSTSSSTQATAGSVKAADDTKSASSTAANSPSETEEDDLPLNDVSVGTQGRDYDLNQIRSELKGLNELKSPSPEIETSLNSTEKNQTTVSTSIFNFGLVTSGNDSKPNRSDSTKPPTLNVIGELKSSSTDVSSETDSFADDDSQSSDKTTTLENMTEKLQQKIKAEKLAQAKNIAAGKTTEKLITLKSAGLEKIIKDSLAEKMQETMKATKPFLIEKSMYNKPLIASSTLDKDEKPKSIVEIKAQLPAKQPPVVGTTTLATPTTTVTKSSSVLPTIIIPEKKAISNLISSITIENKSLASNAATALRMEGRRLHSVDKAELSLKIPISKDAQQNSALSNIKEAVFSFTLTGDKKDTTKSIGASSSLLQKQSSADIYEFKEPEPFEFESRKPPAISLIHSSSESITEKKKKIPTSSAISSAQKQTEISSTAQQDKPASLTAVTVSVSSTKTTQSSSITTGKKTKKSPVKDHLQVMEVKSAKQLKLEEKPSTTTHSKAPATHITSTTSSLLPTASVTIAPSSTSNNISSLLLLPKPENPFDVLRKSPSFNLNINTHNEESISTSVHEIAKPLSDKPVLPERIIPITTLVPSLTTVTSTLTTSATPITASSITSAPTLSSTSILSSSSIISIQTPSPQKVPPSIGPLLADSKNSSNSSDSSGGNLNISSDTANVFVMKSDDESTKSDHNDGQISSNKKIELETVKKILLTDQHEFDLVPKVDKPSIADKVLKVLNQQRQDEKEKKDIKPPPAIVTTISSSLPAPPPPPPHTSSSSSTIVSVPSLSSSTPLKTEASLRCLEQLPKIETLSPVTQCPSSSTPSSSFVLTSEPLQPSLSSSSSSLSSSSSSSFGLLTEPQPPKIELLAKKDLEITIKKPQILTSSPDHKLDILESITPKNFDLSETIHKLESAIQKTSNVDHFDEDSSDSTDSERRLIIEDDSQSSDNETSNNKIQLTPQSSLLPPTLPPPPAIGLVTASTASPIASVQLAPASAPVSISMLTLANVSATLTPAPLTVSVLSQPSIITSSSSSHIESIIQGDNKPPINIKEEVTIIKLDKNTPLSHSSNFLPKYQSSIFGVFSDSSLLSDSGVKPIGDISPIKAEKNNSIEQKPKLEDLGQSNNNLYPHSNISCNVTNIIPKDEPSSNNENIALHSDSINLLLCEETIPGSPTSNTGNDYKPNLHPIEADIKPIPMDIECGPMPCSTNIITSSVAANITTSAITITPTTKLLRVPPTNISGNNIGLIGAAAASISMSTGINENQQTPGSSPRDSNSQDDSSEDLKKQIEQINDTTKKRRRTRKHSETDSYALSKKRRSNTNALTVKRNGSDSEDNSDANVTQRIRPTRPCQYNFLVQLDPAMNPNQRISILRKKIQELRKTYNMIKVELASIERRRKKLRRRKREKENLQKLQQTSS